MEPEERVDPMSKVFPRMTKCNFHKYGGSGTIEVIDALCVLSMVWFIRYFHQSRISESTNFFNEYLL